MKNLQKAFTLIELLIVITIIGLLATTIIAFLNPFEQISKGYDIKRKQELSGLQKAFADYYNDKNKYPLGENVCYSPVVETGNTCSCYICGFENVSSLLPYINRLPCDPQHGKKDYLYQYDCSAGQWFKTYAALEDISTGSGYNFGVNSGNTQLAPYPTSAPTTVPPTTTQPTTAPTSAPTSVPTSAPTTTPSNTPIPTSTLTPTPTINYCQPNVSLWCHQIVGEVEQCTYCGYLDNCLSGSCDNNPMHLFSDSWCNVSCSP